MKQAVNFRLNQQTLRSLAELAKTLNLSKTETIEHALLEYYQKKMHKKPSPLSALSGTISKVDAEAMLRTIREDRIDKNDSHEL